MNNPTEAPIKRMTEDEKSDWIQHQHEMIDPIIPVDFVDNVLCAWGGDCLTAWLNEHADPAANRLFNGIILGYLYQEELKKHKGKVAREMAEDVRDRVYEMIQDMGALGWKW
jgi:hypothetical protein